MTLLLASVTGPAEAEIAVAHGADIIDLKDPAKGALGALDAAAVRSTVAAIAGRRPVSAVTGDLPMQPLIIYGAVEAMAATGADYVKIGLFPDKQREDCIRALEPLARRIKIVGVMFADNGADASLVSLMAQSGFAGAMLDTARKGQGRLLDHADVTSLGAFVRACRDHGLLSGLAGSLEAPDVPRLLLLAPEYLGFRGALCAAHDRKGGLDPAAVSLIRGLIPRDARSAKVEPVERGKADLRLLAAHGYSGDAAQEGGDTDRVFVHDLVLPVRIGAYVHEHAAPQNVRFSVEAEIARANQPAQDMRDVLSYDIMTDGIRLIATDGHTALVETLAERIAAFVLGFPRVQQVTVKIEKLDVGPGHVGVEIRRQRPPEIAKIYQLFPAARTRSAD
jgi:(5-formylfuran-3-yl)methyl phosphate synthase